MVTDDARWRPVPEDADIPTYLRALWHGESGARPGPKRGFDLPTIGAAGVRIADTEGLSAISMRRLASDLGLTTMALYRYVESKNELLMVVVDAAYSRLPGATGDRAWRSALAAWAAANRDVLLAHPWILEVPIKEPPLTPNQIAWMERGLDALAGTVLNEQEKLSSMLLVNVYVRGQVQVSIGVGGAGGDPAELLALYSRRLHALADPQEFPRVAATLMAGAMVDEASDFAVDEFDFGLRTVLDGIAALIERRLH